MCNKSNKKLTDDEIKAIIDDGMIKPPPFDRFFDEIEPRLSEAGDVRFEYEDDSKSKIKWWIPAVSATAAAAAVVCGCIPLMLPDDAAGSPKYGNNDVDYIVYDIMGSDILDDIVLFDLDKVQHLAQSEKISLKNDVSKCLGYQLNDVIYGGEENGTLYAYEFDYMARMYANFEFAKCDMYKDLSEQYSYNNAVYKYAVKEDAAYIAFSAKNNEYFIELRGYEDMTEINADGVEAFIRLAF